MNRRGFLGSILALAAAPAVVRASSLMPVRTIVLPTIAERIAVNQLAAGKWLMKMSEAAPIDVRALARAGLAAWWGEQYDQLTLDYLTAQNKPPLEFNRIHRPEDAGVIRID